MELFELFSCCLHILLAPDGCKEQDIRVTWGPSLFRPRLTERRYYPVSAQ
jgi:hypothetical protein